MCHLYCTKPSNTHMVSIYFTLVIKIRNKKTQTTINTIHMVVLQLAKIFKSLSRFDK